MYRLLSSLLTDELHKYIATANCKLIVIKRCQLSHYTHHAELLCDVSFYFNSYNCKTTKRNDYMMDEQVQLETVHHFCQ